MKLVDKFTYLGSSASSSENGINMWLTKAWTAIDKPSVISKSDLTNKIKRCYFQTVVLSILLFGCTILQNDKEFKTRGKVTILLCIIDLCWGFFCLILSYKFFTYVSTCLLCWHYFWIPAAYRLLYFHIRFTHIHPVKLYLRSYSCSPYH